MKQYAGANFPSYTSNVFLLILYIQTKVIHQTMNDIPHYDNT